MMKPCPVQLKVLYSMADASPLRELGIDGLGEGDYNQEPAVIRFDYIVGFGVSDCEYEGLPCTDIRLLCGNYITVPMAMDDFKAFYEQVTECGISVAPGGW